MPSHDVEGKMIVRRRADGSSEVSLLDPKTGRESRTGWTGKDDRETRQHLEQLAEIVKGSGSRVSVREV